ncbi:TrkA family potassium uptake protein [Candidatus Bathyarchaeota archaeon]|nr:TrkA family potassium uptake protein [Candidatus Bathyarchaeota archaeon]
MYMFTVIVGAGGAGVYLASRLSSEGHKVTVIDIDADALKELTKKAPEASTIIGDASRIEVLRRAGLEKAKTLAVLTGDDDRNLSIAMLAKNEFHVPRVIARINDPKHEWLFDRHTGVDYGFSQDALLVEAVLQAIQTV